MSLHAPVAVAVEVRADARRVFRLSRSVGEDALLLDAPAPFEPGRAVVATFTLPDAEAALALRAEVQPESNEDGEAGGSRLAFIEPPPEARARIAAYVKERLGLPG